MTATGDCYIAAWTTLEELLAGGADAVLVHGRPVYRGEGPGEADDGRFWHAWVEVTERLKVPVNGEPGRFVDVSITVVVDRSNGLDVEMPAALYYRVGELDDEDVTRYARDEAAVLMLRFGHYGPWDGSAPPA